MAILRAIVGSAQTTSECVIGNVAEYSCANARPFATELGTTPIHTLAFSRISASSPPTTRLAFGFNVERVFG